MDTKKAAKEMVESFGDVKLSVVDLVKAVNRLIDSFVKKYTSYIIECADEKEFLHLIADLSDELYQGNVLVEAIDGIVVFEGLKLLDKIVLDKYIGPDWFDKLKKKAIDFQNVVANTTTIGE